MSTHDEIQEATRFIRSGPYDDCLGPRFHDSTRAHCEQGQSAVHQAARHAGLEVAARVREPLCAVLTRAVALFA